MQKNILGGSRIYLSGPMDFVGSRLIEKFFGWRSILTPVLKSLGLTVLDPWNKPVVKGLETYGKEGVIHSKSEYEKDFWTNDKTRARFETDFWETVHIDLRMCDLSDFLIAFTPTNIYSVGTVHEIIVARNQLKPTLLVSPPITYDLFPEIKDLPEKTKETLKYYGLKENPRGLPSQWYGNVVGGNYFFDGFGWENLKLKEPDFYQNLIENVVKISEPDPSEVEYHEQWEKVKNWVEKSEALQALDGGILDHIIPDEDEEELLEKALNDPVEKERQYFWYNVPYVSKRPVIFHLFEIAAGFIPTRLHIMNSLDKKGNMVQKSFESADDSWILIHESEKEKQQGRPETKKKL